MSVPTTYAEFSRASSRTPRLWVLITIKNAISGNFKFLYLSTIAGDLQPDPNYRHGVIESMPTLSYTSKEVTGQLPTPTFSGMKIMAPDGYDLTSDQSGITIDDIGYSWLIVGQNISAHFGGDDLPVLEYQQVFQGTVTKLKRTDTGAILSIAGREKSVTSSTIGGNEITAAAYPNAQINIGKSKPVAFGYCWNVTPIVIDYSTPAAIKYMFHDNSISPHAAFGVYENGVQLTAGANYTDNLDGTFTLVGIRQGLITCYVFGAYSFTFWATMVRDILLNYAGIPAGGISASDVAAANIAFPWSVGVYVSKETPVLGVISRLSQGIPAWWGFNKSGIFGMREVSDPVASTTDWEVAASVSSEIPVAFIDGSCVESPSENVTYRYTIDYYENYTPITTDRLAISLSLSQKSAFSTQWKTERSEDLTVLVLHPEAVTKRILIRSTGPAIPISASGKYLALFKVERRSTAIMVPMMELGYEIGDIMELTYDTGLDGTPYYRHEYNAKKFLILGVKFDFNNYTTTLKLWA